jgi:hypothetical protein
MSQCKAAEWLRSAARWAALSRFFSASGTRTKDASQRRPIRKLPDLSCARGAKQIRAGIKVLLLRSRKHTLGRDIDWHLLFRCFWFGCNLCFGSFSVCRPRQPIFLRTLGCDHPSQPKERCKARLAKWLKLPIQRGRKTLHVYQMMNFNGLPPVFDQRQRSVAGNHHPMHLQCVLLQRNPACPQAPFHAEKPYLHARTLRRNLACMQAPCPEPLLARKRLAQNPCLHASALRLTPACAQAPCAEPLLARKRLAQNPCLHASALRRTPACRQAPCSEPLLARTRLAQKLCLHASALRRNPACTQAPCLVQPSFHKTLERKTARPATLFQRSPTAIGQANGTPHNTVLKTTEGYRAAQSRGTPHNNVLKTPSRFRASQRHTPTTLF